MTFWKKQNDKDRNDKDHWLPRVRGGEETDHKGNFGNEGNICLWWSLQNSTHLSKIQIVHHKRRTLRCVNYTSIQKREVDHWKVVVEGLPWWSKWLRLHTPNAGSLGSIPGQETRSHMLWLSAHMIQLKILCATAKTQGGQINNGMLQSMGSLILRTGHSLSIHQLMDIKMFPVFNKYK